MSDQKRHKGDECCCKDYLDKTKTTILVKEQASLAWVQTTKHMNNFLHKKTTMLCQHRLTIQTFAETVSSEMHRFSNWITRRSAYTILNLSDMSRAFQVHVLQGCKMTTLGTFGLCLSFSCLGVAMVDCHMHLVPYIMIYCLHDRKAA